MSRTLRHQEQGFTLIELLVVILIVGIPRCDRSPAFLGPAEEGPGRFGEVRRS
jgi:prepilin-type N-terminal cleavage/methylation domain-containing protein